MTGGPFSRKVAAGESVKVAVPWPLPAKGLWIVKAKVTADGCEKPFDGWIGYISPTAEFTPKTIETDELRPTLVYETRVYVNDPEGLLKLGAPVVVELK